MKLIALFFFCLMPGFAQSTLSVSDAISPNFSGLVQDAVGAVIAGAHVWIHEGNGKETFAVTTDSSGKFSVHLPEGYYDVMIASPAFEPFSKSIWVHGEKKIKLKIKLKVDEKNMQMID